MSGYANALSGVPFFVSYNLIVIIFDKPNVCQETLQTLFTKSHLFISGDCVSEMLYNMIWTGFWDLKYKNRCIKEVLRHGPSLDKLDKHGKTLLHSPFTWREAEFYTLESCCGIYNPCCGQYIEHLEEALYALIPAGADLRAVDMHGETITETANRRQLCGVWEKALIDCGHNAKHLIAADLRVGLIYRSLDGSIIEGTRLADHNPEYICEGCKVEEWRWRSGKCLEVYGNDSWLWGNAWPQWVRRPCERYYNWILDKEPEHRDDIEEDSDEESREEYSEEEYSEEEYSEEEYSEEEETQMKGVEYDIMIGSKERYCVAEGDSNMRSASPVLSDVCMGEYKYFSPAAFDPQSPPRTIDNGHSRGFVEDMSESEDESSDVSLV
ncbi:Protein of unknown function [Pyronema omphalodes CBS 100304]|nr:Protein of unknown function [Pyronema omphalodes CBS 100304]